MSLDQVQVHQEGGHVNTCSPGSDSLDKALSGILDGYKCPRPIQEIGWTLAVGIRCRSVQDGGSGTIRFAHRKRPVFGRGPPPAR